MKERIALVGSGAAAVATNFMMSEAHVTPEGVFAEVSVTINGVPVSFSSYVNAFNEALEAEARRMAVEMVASDPTLDHIRSTLMRARLEISGIVNKMQAPKKGGVDEEMKP